MLGANFTDCKLRCAAWASLTTQKAVPKTTDVCDGRVFQVVYYGTGTKK
jgi:hypothetical protein